MNLVVLKFGGTSLASSKLMHNAAMKVAEEIKLGNNVIVVVSAMAGVTDQLINLSNEVISSDIENYKNNDYFAEYASIITTGEQVSAGIFALLLQQLGFKARSWLGWQAGIITDSNFSDAEIDSINFHNITDSFNQGYKVAVVCGFQGITKDSRITTLGRGGSDTSAIIIAGALKAKRCDIYTDVEGVFTSDPRIVPKAHKLEFINYDEMIAFSYAGAKVLQAKSANWAKYYQINVQVLSSFSGNSGTIIGNYPYRDPVAGVALSYQNNVAYISVIGYNIDKNTELLYKLVNSLKLMNIDLFLEDSSTMCLKFIIDNDNKLDAIIKIHKECNLD